MEIIVVNTNSVDPDKTPRSAAADLGLHCLSIALLGLQVNCWFCGFISVYTD